MEPSPSQLRAILEGVPDAVVAVGPGGELIACNRNYVALWNVPDEVLAVGSTARLIDFVLGQVEDPDAFRRRYENPGDRAAEPFSDTVRLRDGRIFERQVRPLWLDGTFGGRVISYRDVTTRHALERAYRESETRFRTVFETSPVGIAILDLDGKVRDANPALSAMMGYSLEELCRLRPQDVTFPSDIPGELDHLAELIAGRSDHYSMEKRYVRKDGRVIWAELAVSLGRDPLGKPLFVIGFATDVTERKQTDEALRASEEQYRGLYSRTPVMMHSIDQDGRLLSVSDYWLDTLGYTREEVIGHRSIEFLTPASAEFAAQKVLPDFFRGGVVRNVPYQFVKKNGEVLDTLLSGIMERDGHGRPVRSLAVIIDVTEQKRAEEERNHLLVKEREARVEAQRAVQLRDEFIAVASHELRTPITPVKLQLQLIARVLSGRQYAGIPKLPELQGILKAADRELDRLSGLVEDMLVISRLSAGRLVLNLSDVNLSELVLGCVEHFRDDFAEAGCRVELALPPDIRGRYDPVLIQRVLCSLLGNAVKYGRGKPIEVSAVAEFGKAKLMVRDHGIGIEKSEQSRIFERFARGVSIREYGGFGFGLYLAKQIVQAHGGQIDVESEPGAGARFTVVLPRARGAPAERG